MQDKKLQKLFRILHIIGWIFIALVPYVLTTNQARFSLNNIIIWTKGLVFTIALFYLFYGYVIRVFLKSGGLLKFFAIAFLFFCSFAAVEITVDQFIWKILKPDFTYSLPSKIMTTIFLDGFIVAMALLVLLIENWFYTQRYQQEMEMERLESELKMLKFQVNPHFLFNTLNNIYSLVYKKSDSAPEAVLRLSSLMRYMLYDTEGSSVALSKELEYLHNFVELQRLRLVSNQQVKMTVQGDSDGYQIAPLLLVPFIENAFKHGTRASKETMIDISIMINGGELVFRCENDFDPDLSSQVNSGIGMTNVKKRLELMYSNRYKLNIDTSDRKYKVTLILSL